MMTKEINVLVCDDSLLIRRKLEMLLKSLGDFKIYHAANGSEALQCVEENDIHLVLLDIVMPVMDGISCLKGIKEFDKDIKVVCISSVGTRDKLKTVLDLGAVEFIQKPWEEETFKKILIQLKEKIGT